MRKTGIVVHHWLGPATDAIWIQLKKTMIKIRFFVDLICRRCVLTVNGQCEERVHCVYPSHVRFCGHPEHRDPIPHISYFFCMTFNVNVWNCTWRRRSWPSSYSCFDFRFGLVRLLPLLWLQVWTCPWQRRSWPSSSHSSASWRTFGSSPTAMDIPR